MGTDVTKNKSQTSNQSNKGAIKLKDILSEEDKDGKNNAQEFSNENVNLKDPNVNLKSEESTNPETNEGAIGLRNILTNADEKISTESIKEVSKTMVPQDKYLKNETETEESSDSKASADLSIEKKVETITQQKEKLEENSGSENVES